MRAGLALGQGLPRLGGRRLQAELASRVCIPSPCAGQTRTLRFVSNITQSDHISLRWERFEPLEARDLLSFIVYYKES